MYGINDDVARLERQKRDAEREAADARAELDRVQEEQARQREQQRQERRREMDQRYEEAMRTADSWPAALSKQARLFRREQYLEDADDPREDFMFSTGAAARDRAGEIYQEEAAKVADQVAALRQQIAELEQGVAVATADRLEQEPAGQTSGGRDVVAALREYTAATVDEWLEW